MIFGSSNGYSYKGEQTRVKIDNGSKINFEPQKNRGIAWNGSDSIYTEMDTLYKRKREKGTQRGMSSLAVWIQKYDFVLSACPACWNCLATLGLFVICFPCRYQFWEHKIEGSSCSKHWQLYILFQWSSHTAIENNFLDVLQGWKIYWKGWQCPPYNNSLHISYLGGPLQTPLQRRPLILLSVACLLTILPMKCTLHILIKLLTLSMTFYRMMCGTINYSRSHLLTVYKLFPKVYIFKKFVDNLFHPTYLPF